MNQLSAVTGEAAGVPFLAVPPASAERGSAPVVVAWHMMDAPRTEAAFAAAIPMDGLEAWRIYLGLPMCGSRLPAGGVDEIMRLGYEDAVLNLQGPIVAQAAAEFPAAFRELRVRLGLDGGPLGLVGGSIGATVALQVAAEGEAAVEAMVLISPLTRLQPAVDAMAQQFGFAYPWPPAAREVARRLDFAARADEIAARRPAILLVVGEKDDEAGFLRPARDVCDAIAERYAGPAEDVRSPQLVVIPGMGHALAEEPGVEPAPQTPHAAAADRHAVDWLRPRL